jgi:hypothetical protein
MGAAVQLTSSLCSHRGVAIPGLPDFSTVIRSVKWYEFRRVCVYRLQLDCLKWSSYPYSHWTTSSSAGSIQRCAGLSKDKPPIALISNFPLFYITLWAPTFIPFCYSTPSYITCPEPSIPISLCPFAFYSPVSFEAL